MTALSDHIAKVACIHLHRMTATIDVLEKCDISDCNFAYQRAVCEKIWESGRSLDDMKLGEIVEIIDQIAVEFNKL